MGILTDFLKKKKKDKSYYTTVFLKESKYIEKRWLDILLMTWKFLLIILIKKILIKKIKRNDFNNDVFFKGTIYV